MKRILLGIAVSAALCACDVNARILMVGDSNMQGAAGIYAAMLRGGWVSEVIPGYLPTFDIYPGSGVRDSALWASALSADRAAHAFDASVVNLGVNDCTTVPRFPGDPPYAFNPTDYASRVDAIMASLPAGPVVWIGPAVPTRTTHNSVCIAAVNNALVAAASRHARLVYLSAESIIRGLPASQQYIDGLHYHQSAQIELGRAITEALSLAL